MRTRSKIGRELLQWQYRVFFIIAVALAACEGGGNNRGDRPPDDNTNGNPITSPNTGTIDSSNQYRNEMQENRVGEGTFNTLDVNQDGTLSRQEWEQRGNSTAKNAKGFEELDSNQDGKIDQSEFDVTIGGSQSHYNEDNDSI
ncbi:MAG: hypothetical protein ACK4TA_14310 [Saprospiraceae bacterium]